MLPLVSILKEILGVFQFSLVSQESETVNSPLSLEIPILLANDSTLALHTFKATFSNPLCQFSFLYSLQI